MGKLIYIVKRACDIDYGRMFQTLKRLHKKTHYSYSFLIKDILSCSKNHGAGYVDYDIIWMKIRERRL